MKRSVLALIALFCTFRLAAQTNRPLVVHLSQPGKVFTLNVNIGRAAIRVSGYDGKDVVMEASAEGITAQEKNNEVTVTSSNRKVAVTLNIKVPKTAGIFKLSSLNGGTIMANDVTGNLELQNKSGGISALNISGTVIAGTLSGNVMVSFKQVDPGTPMAFSTVSGAIDITFPASLNANLKIRSDIGKVYSEFPLTDDLADWRYAKAGSGGPEMLIKNTNGNIHIYKRE